MVLDFKVTYFLNLFVVLLKILLPAEYMFTNIDVLSALLTGRLFVVCLLENQICSHFENC